MADQPTNSYRVIWEIDIEEKSPLDAALAAESYQFDQVNYFCPAGVFQVIDNNTKELTTIDLAEYYYNNNKEEEADTQ